MRIGIDIRLIGKKRTGDEVVFFNLVKNLARIGTDHEFELLTDITDKKLLKEISENLGIVGKDNFKIVALTPTLSQGERGKWKFLHNRFAWNFWTLPRYLRKNPVDIYLTQYITPFFVPRSIKIATIVHDLSFNFFPQLIKFSDLLFLKTLIPFSLGRADKIIGVSQFTRDEIIKFYQLKPEKVDYIYNAIGEEFLNSNISQAEKEAVREKYQLPENFILYLGTLQPRKNIPQLVEAFNAIKAKLGDTKLVLCGNLEAHNADRQIEKTVKKYALEKEVVFPGFIDEQNKVVVFSLAQVFVFPSLYEGFGIPPLEAMSQNAAVLCSDIPSLREIAGDGAVFFDLRSLDDFSEKLYAISTDNELRSRLIRLGQERIGFFDWEKSANKILAIFEKM